jgi:hypothetical protein
MEKLTLTPQHHELIVNNGSPVGAVDLFSYGPETDLALHQLGSLYIIGHRATDSSNMSYIVSLIAALARREYYAQPGDGPKEAFTRMLKKVNEVVDEFFRSASVDLSVGIFAIAGSSIMVSKLEKFKILLARDGQTIDILNNVALFTKENIQKHRFSSVISGSVQVSDRILAYYPSKPISTRERYIKSYLNKLPCSDFIAKVTDIGRQHPTFAAAMLCVDMVQSSEPLAHDAPPTATYAWKPRQSSSDPAMPTAPAVPVVPEPETEPEVPNIIPTEFALGTRRSPLSKWLGRVKFVRLDTRGKAIFMAATALIVIAGVLGAKSILFVDPQEQKTRQLIESIRTDVQASKTQEPAQARQVLMRALATLASGDLRDNKDARALTASLIETMDVLDNAQNGQLSLLVHLDPNTDPLALAVWSSTSAGLFAVVNPDNASSVIRIEQASPISRIDLGSSNPSLLVPFKQGVIALDTAARTMIRVTDGITKTFALATQDVILSAAVYNDTLYILTDHAILKITDLDTNKPVTKQWLADVSDLAPGSAQIFVDGSVRTMDRDGMLSLYYKGKKTGTVQTPLEPSGNWRLLPGPQDDQLAVANADTKRIYIVDTSSGALVRTIKVDTQQTILQMLSGPDGSILFITKDNTIWKVQ